MSICTRTGDKGTTGLMYNRRVSKTHPRIEACGAIDELNAGLGMARASLSAATSAESEFISAKILHIQKELINLMGEIGTDKTDLERYAKDGFKIIAAGDYSPLDSWIKEIEAQSISFKGWATPGATPSSAALDLARTIARRAERRVEELLQTGESENRHLQVYLNRVSDLLWLMARWIETRSEAGNKAPGPESTPPL